METVLLPVKNVDSVGITDTDICILSTAGASWVFSTPNSIIKDKANAIIDMKSLSTMCTDIARSIKENNNIWCIKVDNENQTASVIVC